MERMERPNSPNISAESVSQLSAQRPQMCDGTSVCCSPSCPLAMSPWKRTSTSSSSRTTRRAPSTDRVTRSQKAVICLATNCWVVCYTATQTTETPYSWKPGDHLSFLLSTSSSQPLWLYLLNLFWIVPFFPYALSQSRLSSSLSLLLDSSWSKKDHLKCKYG